MRKIRQYLLYVALIAIFLPFTSSCDDDDRYYSPLIGVWEVVSETDIFHRFEFDTDGRGYYITYDWYDNPYYEEFYWHEDYDTVYLSFHGGYVWGYQYRIVNRRLYLYNIDYYTPYPMEYRYVGVW